METSVPRYKNINESQPREIKIYLHIVNITVDIQNTRNEKNLKAARKKTDFLQITYRLQTHI